MFLISAFYKIFDFENVLQARESVKLFMKESSIVGTVIFSEKEGINATVSGTKEDVEKLVNFLSENYSSGFDEYKESFCEYKPFSKFKIRCRKEVVKFGVPGISMKDSGEYVNSCDWAKILKERRGSENFDIIDVRNFYEAEFGTFETSVVPKTDSFWQFKHWFDGFSCKMDKDRHSFAIFCTGGMRCEKGGAYMRSLGFKNIYKLKGGVLQYFLDTKDSMNLWSGSCFVFDDRVAVNKDSMRSGDIKCKKCNFKVSVEDLKSVSRGDVICSACRENKLHKKNNSKQAVSSVKGA